MSPDTASSTVPIEESPEPAVVTPRVRTAWQLLRENHDFRCLTEAQTLNVLGSALTSVAVARLAYQLTESAFLTNLIGAVGMASMLICGVVAGHYADRHDRLRLMMMASLTAACAVGTLVVAHLTIGMTYLHLLGVWVVLGGTSALFLPAESASVPMIVEAQDRATATSITMMRLNLSRIFGMALAGPLYGLSRVAPFAIDLLSYVISVFLLRRVRADLRPPVSQASAGDSMLTSIREGMRWALRAGPLTNVIAVASLANFGFSGATTTMLTMIQTEGISDHQYALATASFAVWGVVGAALAPVVLQRVRAGTATLVGFGCGLLLLTTLALPLPWWAWVVATGASVLMGAPGNIAMNSYLMTVTPASVQGRMNSAFFVLNMAPVPLGIALGGIVLEHWGRTAAIIPFIVCACTAGVLFAMNPLLRSLPHTRDFGSLPTLPGPEGTIQDSTA